MQDKATEARTEHALARCRRLAFLEVVFDSGGAAPGTSALFPSKEFRFVEHRGGFSRVL